ncbi:hypothetical protein HDU82_006767, partial [Entophlyctis luteolus]
MSSSRTLESAAVKCKLCGDFYVPRRIHKSLRTDEASNFSPCPCTVKDKICFTYEDMVAWDKSIDIVDLSTADTSEFVDWKGGYQRKRPRDVSKVLSRRKSMLSYSKIGMSVTAKSDKLSEWRPSIIEGSEDGSLASWTDRNNTPEEVVREEARASSKKSIERELRVNPKMMKHFQPKVKWDVDIEYEEWGTSTKIQVQKSRRGAISLQQLRNPKEAQPKQNLSYTCRMRKRSNSDCMERKINLLSIVPSPGFTYAISNEFLYEKYDNAKMMTLNPLDYYRFTVKEYQYKFGDWIVKYRIYNNGQEESCEIEYIGKSEPEHTAVASAIVYFMVNFTSVRSFEDFLDMYIYHKLQTYKFTILDTNDITITSDMTYKVKPDGEAVLLINGGYLWFICRNDKPLTICGFRTKSTLSPYISKPDISRCELMYDGSLIFLFPIVYDGDGVEIDRRLDVEDQIFLGSSFSGITVIRRSVFGNFDNACEELGSVLYPCDGIVGRSTTGIEYRYKNSTVDMYLKGTTLKTGCDSKGNQGTVQVKGVTLPHLLRDRVYECLVSFDANEKCQVREYHYRPDKQRPNSTLIYKHVILKSSGESGTESIAYTFLLNYSSQVRQEVFRLATSDMAGKLIIDIGCGKIKDHLKLYDKERSYLFCDPALREQDITKYFDRARDITPMTWGSRLNSIRDANSRGSTVLYMIGTFGELMEDTNLISYLSDSEIPLVFNFSMPQMYVEFVKYIFNHGESLNAF